MIPAEFEYAVAQSVDEAIQLLSANEDAKVLAGGHSLLPLMKIRLATPAMLVDIGGIAELKGVSDGGDHLVIGALTRHHDVEHDPLVQEHCPLLSDTAGTIGDRQVRHRGTIGGAVAHSDPAGDYPATLVTLDATVVARGPGGERTIPIADFFTGVFESVLAEDEILTAIRVPKATGSGWAYVKFNQRKPEWAIVGVAALVSASNGTIDSARVALTNMGSAPIRATAVEQALAGASADSVGAAAEHAAEGTNPPDDTFASAEYRKHLAKVLTKRALEQALAG